MINTINVSIPSKLKKLADNEVKKGYYASFSDLVRTSLRETLLGSKYNQQLKET